MFGLFKRVAADRMPDLPPQRTPERDWGPGDVAKCVSAGAPWTSYPDGKTEAGPARGQCARVVGVTVIFNVVALSFREWPGCYFVAGEFKKLRPCSADFREQISRRTPVREPERVR